jgi:hypothetical protein
MTRKEFRQAVNDGLKNIVSRNLETMAADKMDCRNVFNYATWCEINFEKNLREDYTRKTTFTSDLSIAEWCESQEKGAVLDTLRRCLLEWHNNIEYFAELIIAINMKSWEHHARKNKEWCAFYADLYYLVKDLFFDWFDDSNPKATDAVKYYMDYVD